MFTANINWRALYKWLESEVEEMIFDPNAPQYLKDWGTKILRTRQEVTLNL